MEIERSTNLFVRILAWLRGLFGAGSNARTGGDGLVDQAEHGGRSGEHGRVVAQVDVIKSEFGDTVGIAYEDDADESSVQYLYRAEHCLVALDRVDELRQYFADHQDQFSGVGEVRGAAIGDLTLFEFPRARAERPDAGLSTIRMVDAALGERICTPDHLVYVTYRPGGLCPATEPDEPNRDLPWPRETRDADRGAGVMINVVDTGWWKPASQDPEAPWLAYGVDGDAEQINPAAIHPYGGHGTFVAGVIRCQAPQAEVYVDGMLTKGGAIFESELMQQLDNAVLSGDAPNIVSISGGTHTYNDQPLMTFEHLARKHNLLDNPNAPLIVAAAGNDSTDAPFWPAAFDWVVGVGALDRDDTVSDYSNYGDWVDIYALGRDHVNAYPTGTYTCYEPPNVGEVRQFKNLAKWSGTSFSTPLITGLIAGIMSEHGLTAHEAWARLKAHGIARMDPNVGEILTVDTPGD